QGRHHGEAHVAFRPGSSVGMSYRLKSGRSPVRSRPWPPGESRRQIQQRGAGLRIYRHRNVIMDDEPIALDPAKARRPPNPKVGSVPILQYAAYSIDAV